MSEPFDNEDPGDSDDFGYLTFNIDTGLATIAKLQELILQANRLESQIIEMIRSKELELANVQSACADLANFQLALRLEMKEINDHIEDLREHFRQNG